jgi:hypothetical protein
MAHPPPPGITRITLDNCFAHIAYLDRNNATGASKVHVETENYMGGSTTVDFDLTAADTSRFLYNQDRFMKTFAVTYNPIIDVMHPGGWNTNIWNSSRDEAALARVTALVYAAQLANKQVNRDVLAPIPTGPQYTGARSNEKKLIIFAFFALFCPKRFRSEIITRAGGLHEEIQNFTFHNLHAKLGTIMNNEAGYPLPVIFR